MVIIGQLYLVSRSTGLCSLLSSMDTQINQNNGYVFVLQEIALAMVTAYMSRWTNQVKQKMPGPWIEHGTFRKPS